MADSPFAALLPAGTLGSPAGLTLDAAERGRGARCETFTNPVCESGADPWVLRWRGTYLYCQAAGGSVRVSRARQLHEIGRRPAATVWTPPSRGPCSRHLWAPELHHLDGRFYIYVAADDGRNCNHRMYVLEGDAADAQQPFVLKGRIADASDRWAIDGTVLTLDDGRRYFIWSGWNGRTNAAQSLYAAAMANPWTITGSRVRISSPDRPWEMQGRPLVNEGPAVLRNRRGQVFIVYSASGSWTDDYCLGLLRLVGDDPLRPGAWLKNERPVFVRSPHVFGPGHASFVRSPDGQEDWIVYHAAQRRGSGWRRNVRMQRFGWASDGSPELGVPIPAGQPLSLPSGSSGERSALVRAD